jgi:hypothetical protein
MPNLPKIKPFRHRDGFIELHLCIGCGYILGRRGLYVIPHSLGHASREPICFHDNKECRRAAKVKLDAVPKRAPRGPNEGA